MRGRRPLSRFARASRFRGLPSSASAAQGEPHPEAATASSASDSVPLSRTASCFSPFSGPRSSGLSSLFLSPEDIQRFLDDSTPNLVFVGLPGSGISSIARVVFQHVPPHETGGDDGSDLKAEVTVARCGSLLEFSVTVLPGRFVFDSLHLASAALPSSSGVCRMPSSNSVSPQSLSDVVSPKTSSIPFPASSLPLLGSADLASEEDSWEEVLRRTDCLVFVLDVQSETALSEDLPQASAFLKQAWRIKPQLFVEIFLHKSRGGEDARADGVARQLEETLRMQLNESLAETKQGLLQGEAEAARLCFRACQKKTAGCGDSGPSGEASRVSLASSLFCFASTCIFDASVFQASSRAVQRLFHHSEICQEMLARLVQSCRFEKAILFDADSRLCLASDAAAFDASTFELVAEIVEMGRELKSIYAAEPPGRAVDRPRRRRRAEERRAEPSREGLREEHEEREGQGAAKREEGESERGAADGEQEDRRKREEREDAQQDREEGEQEEGEREQGKQEEGKQEQAGRTEGAATREAMKSGATVEGEEQLTDGDSSRVKSLFCSKTSSEAADVVLAGRNGVEETASTTPFASGAVRLRSEETYLVHLTSGLLLLVFAVDEELRVACVVRENQFDRPHLVDWNLRVLRHAFLQISALEREAHSLSVSMARRRRACSESCENAKL
ncbi:Gtr1/RagA protein G [Toxoplasma gondii VAND]|uniref:Gtr1/RagA protein G n=1 Tax=Toxoplasma gondii VAND TaxID=933077 RepID=A0A086PHF2_TOXGO|nr:Gtr1/RagA protein G [Toxoplasma gondii VAND]